MTAINVKDASGATVAINALPALGAALDSGSLPVSLSNESKALLAAIVSVLGTPAQAGGAVTVAGVATAAAQATGNSSLASLVSNTTGLALHADIMALATLLSGTLAVSGPLTATQLGAAALATAAGQAAFIANTAPAGLGGMAAVPAGSTNGTALTLPTGAKGVRFYLGAGDSVTFTIATATPTAAPSATFTISGASGGTGPNWDESLAGTAVPYILSRGGNPLWRPY